MPDDNAAIATEFLRLAQANQDGTQRVGFSVISIAASLVHANETEARLRELDERAKRDGDRAQDYFEALVALRDELQVMRSILGAAAPDQPEHEIRWLRAFVAGEEFPAITPEEPEPGRDWSKVEGHLFNANGKWKYQVWLDYSSLRHRRIRGEGPSGWHYDGAEMARSALRDATDRGTSDVTYREIPDGWRLFVRHPPQGYPVYAVGGAEDRKEPLHPNAGEMFP